MAAKPTAVKCPTCYAKPGGPCTSGTGNPTRPHAARKRAAGKKAPAKRKPGRPSKLTPEVQAAVLANIATGAPLEFCARAAGVTYQTLRNWIKAGEREGTEFFEAIKATEARAVITLMREVSYGGQGWQAKAWILERRHRDHFSRPPTVQVAAQATGAGASVNVVDMSGTSDADLQKRLEQLRKEQG